jgi:peroxidase
MKHDCIEFARATFAFPDEQCQSNLREQLNMQTSFIDASHVYGTDLETLNKVRQQPVGKGMLTLQKGTDILPPDMTPQPADCLEFTNQTRCFVAGDNRVNQNFALMTMHTLFVREHNRYAQILSSLNPSWDDETVFQEARRIIIAIEQHVTYNEYLPILLSRESRERNGLIVGTTFKYDENVDPRMSNEVNKKSLFFFLLIFNPTFGCCSIHAILPQKFILVKKRRRVDRK